MTEDKMVFERLLEKRVEIDFPRFILHRLMD
jgi:hypothetical protein